MPPRMMTGVRRASRTALTDATSSFASNFSDVIAELRRTRMNTTTHNPAAMMSAGMTEAANSAPVEVAARPAKMTAGMLGGMTGAMSAADEESPVAKRRP